MGNHRNFGRSSCRAFSLIELLVVTAILGLVIGAIGACLAGGFRLWDAAQHFGTGESRAYMGLHTMVRDLRNTFPCHCGAAFTGESYEMAFPAMVAGLPGEAKDQIGTIQYVFERSEQRVLRRILDNAEQVVSEEIALYPVEDLTFVYRQRLASGAAGPELNLTTNIPFVVDVRFTLEPDGPDALELHRTIVLRTRGASS
jgi:prepilin-type N-terminal cleavage/methylation domain-containing protein